jgi:hypothetical protein
MVRIDVRTDTFQSVHLARGPPLDFYPKATLVLAWKLADCDVVPPERFWLFTLSWREANSTRATQLFRRFHPKAKFKLRHYPNAA